MPSNPEVREPRITDDEIMQILAASQRLKPQIFKAYMFVILREMSTTEYRGFMKQIYDARKELGR